jgi:hypothetical protein
VRGFGERAQLVAEEEEVIALDSIALSVGIGGKMPENVILLPSSHT